MQRKILAAVDGSVYSSNILHYLSRLFKGQNNVFFNLLCVVPGGPFVPGREWLDEQEIITAMQPAARNRYAAAGHYMKSATRQLIRNGINPEQISTQVRISRIDVATDILNEARKGLYDALIIGRRGLTKLEELIIGSVSTSVLEKCHNVPIWIVDGKIDSHKFLLPVDETPHALQAIERLCFILKGNPYAEVTLFNSPSMFARKSAVEPEFFYEHWEKAWCDLHLSGPDSLFHAPEQLLLENGFPRDRIHRIHTSMGIDPSRQILRQALIDDFGTIVMGRRGKDVKKGIFRGVSDRVILMAEEVAILIVG